MVSQDGIRPPQRPHRQGDRVAFGPAASATAAPTVAGYRRSFMSGAWPSLRKFAENSPCGVSARHCTGALPLYGFVKRQVPPDLMVSVFPLKRARTASRGCTAVFASG